MSRQSLGRHDSEQWNKFQRKSNLLLATRYPQELRDRDSVCYRNDASEYEEDLNVVILTVTFHQQCESQIRRDPVMSPGKQVRWMMSEVGHNQARERCTTESASYVIDFAVIHIQFPKTFQAHIK
jgi:hypothetical protein